MSTPITATSAAAQARSLYRRLLRELPPSTHPHASLSSPSPLRASIRTQFLSHPANANADADAAYTLARRQEVDQAVRYLRAQRMYGTLLARYNPGADMDEEERVRLTARRVGMEMPEEWYGKGKAGEFGVEFEAGKKKKREG